MTIQELDYKHALRKVLNQAEDRFKSAVSKLGIEQEHSGIKVSDLALFPYNVWTLITPRIKIRKRKNRFGNFLNFDVEMKKGARFAEHFHEDGIESAEVVSGELVDTSENNKIYKKGDVAHWDKNVNHTPIANEDTFLHVLFKLD